MSSKKRSSAEDIASPKKAKTVETDARETMNKMLGDYIRPSDWPAAGQPIDLTVQDLPHASANTEWWYINSHVTAANGRKYGLFASFFRIHRGKTSDSQHTHLHALSAGIVDVENKNYYPIAFVDPETPKVLKYQLENGMYELDSRLSRALMEVVNRGNIPLPDVPLAAAADVSTSGLLNLDYHGGNTFKKNADGTYDITVKSEHVDIAFNLHITPKKKVTLQGHDGVVQVGIKRETMFYYFIPRNDAVGSLTIKGETTQVTGNAWYDHEFGGGIRDNVYGEGEEEKMKEDKKTEKDNSYAWDWFSIQLDNGIDITATNLIDATKNVVYDRFAVFIDADSTRKEVHDFKLAGSEEWMSVRSATSYPTKWHLTSEEGQMDLEVEAVFPQQEIVTLISKPAFWEGKMTVKGTLRGQQVTGNAFLERHGYEEINSLDSFFKRISKVVREEIHDILPYNPTYEQARELIASEDADHLMEGVNVSVLESTLIKPLREVIDRGGKSWRSYACLLCVDCVGGNSHKYRHWLAMPEIMHVGSLIVDDIQDKSETRRGGQSCHLVYGDAIAINAGNAAYFLAMDILQNRTPDLTPQQRLRLFELYFLTLRAGHGGQAFDINGLGDVMEGVCAGKEDPETLVKRVTCTHRLKSAVPAGNLARMGAYIGGGNKVQAESIGMYFESIGVAFQVIDDVLNLRGFEGNVKRRGEDICMGKITFPVAYAMTKLPVERRKAVWDIIQSKPQDDETVLKVIKELESVDAIEQSVVIATKMVDDAWAVLDKEIPDSFYKLMLRSFGWYVLERHY